MLFSARIKELESQLAAVTTERDEALAANTSCQEQYEADQKTIAALTGERDAARADLAKANTSLEAANKELTEVKAGVDRKVVETIAAAGIDPIKRSGADESSTKPAGGGDVLAQYEAIKDEGMKTEFMRQHKRAIYAARDAAKRAEEAKAA